MEGNIIHYHQYHVNGKDVHWAAVWVMHFCQCVCLLWQSFGGMCFIINPLNWIWERSRQVLQYTYKSMVEGVQKVVESSEQVNKHMSEKTAD